MARNLGTLTLDLVVKLGGFTQGMDRAAREVDRTSKRIRSSLDNVSKGVAVFGRGLAALGVGFSVGGIVRGLADATKEAIEFGDAIAKAQAKTGLGAEAISELAAVAKQSEVDLDTLTTALRNMQVVISDAGAGSKEAGLVLRDLGLTFAELAALAPDRQFELIAQRISEFSSEADRAALRQDVFKRAAEGLAPIMEDGARGIREARDAVRELGGTLSQEQVDAFAKADQAIDDLTTAYTGLKRAIGGVLAEPVAEFFNGVAQAMGNANDEALTLGDRTGLVFEAMKRAFEDEGILAGPLDLARAYAKITEEANKAGQATQQFSSLASTLGFPEPTTATRQRTARTTARGRIDPAPELQELSVAVRQITVSATEQLYRDMDAATQTSLDKQLAEWERFTAEVQALVDAGRITQEEALRRNAEKTDEFLQEIEITAERMTVPVKEAIEEVSEFAKEAARNMQDAFADFLFDPFADGLDGMLEGFATTLRRMAAEIVAAQLAEKFGFEKFFSGDFSGLTGLFGRGGGAELSPVEITAQRLPEAGGEAAAAAFTAAATTGATALTTAGTGTAASLTAAGTAIAASLTAAATTGAAALTASGTVVAGSITAAGATAAAAIAAAAASGSGASGLSEIVISAARLAEGGKVLGPGTATSDSIPAWLSAGEFVVKAAAVKQPGMQALLERINAGNGVFGRFAAGGFVSDSGRAAPEAIIAGRIAPAVTDGNTPGMVVNQHFHITAPAGTVSQPTQLQVMNAGARGVSEARRRNG